MSYANFWLYFVVSNYVTKGWHFYSYLTLLQDNTQQVRAGCGDALDAFGDFGLSEALVEGLDEAELFGFGGVGMVAGEGLGDVVLEEEVALGHVVAEVALHDAGVDEGSTDIPVCVCVSRRVGLGVRR